MVMSVYSSTLSINGIVMRRATEGASCMQRSSKRTKRKRRKRSAKLHCSIIIMELFECAFSWDNSR